MFKTKRLTIFVEKCSYFLNSGVIRSLHDGKCSTIFALSSGFGKCGVSVVRVSGPGVKVALSEVSGFKKLPTPRKAELRKIRHPITKELLDHGIVFWFPGPRSFTGEDCCEFQVHGSPAVVSALLNALGKLDDFRPALPGEFTKRAFYSGKLDLPGVEGLGALIHSETELQRVHALYQLSGALSALYSTWTESLLKCLAHLEAHIDFDEDQDIDKDVLDKVKDQVTRLIQQIKDHLVDGRKGERVREGVEMTILGPPNSGKSSLLNLLSRREAAIVSSTPGTTRDVVRTHLDLNGYPVNLSDTAGLRGQPSDAVEAEGMCRAKKSAATADLVLFVFDSDLLLSSLPSLGEDNFKQLLASWLHLSGVSEEVSRCGNLSKFLNLEGGPCAAGVDEASRGLIVLNKSDLLPAPLRESPVLAALLASPSLALISCKTDFGIQQFQQKLTAHLEHLCGVHEGEVRGFSRPYQRHSLEDCLRHLVQYLEDSASGRQVDLTAEVLRSALLALGRLTGRVSPEQLLDVIFADFCIGK